jgi:hypothetical protein
MRYYISNLKAFEIKKMDVLNNCIKKNDYYTLIFSLDGIFKLNKNTKTFKKCLYKDIESKPIILNENKDNTYELLEDNSECNYIDYFQIPKEHFSKKIKSETYTLRENAMLKFVIIKEDTTDSTINNIIDFYFDTNDSIHNKFIIEDISCFLSFKK